MTVPISHPIVCIQRQWRRVLLLACFSAAVEQAVLAGAAWQSPMAGAAAIAAHCCRQHAGMPAQHARVDLPASRPVPTSAEGSCQRRRPGQHQGCYGGVRKVQTHRAGRCCWAVLACSARVQRGAIECGVLVAGSAPIVAEGHEQAKQEAGAHVLHVVPVVLHGVPGGRERGARACWCPRNANRQD